MPTMNGSTPEANHFQAPDDNKNINEGAEIVGACVGLIAAIAVVAAMIVGLVDLCKTNSHVAELKNAQIHQWKPEVCKVVDEDGMVHNIYTRQFGFHHAELVESLDNHHELVYWNAEPGGERFIHMKSRCKGCAEIAFHKKHFTNNLNTWLDNHSVPSL